MRTVHIVRVHMETMSLGDSGGDTMVGGSF